MSIEGERTIRKTDSVKSFLHRSRKTVLLIIAVALTTMIFNVLIAIWLSHSDNLTIPSIGTVYVTGVEAYGGDLKLEGDSLHIDWGTIYLGSSKNASFYLKSVSNTNIKLVLNVTNWNPKGMAPYMNLSWTYTGTPLSPDEVIPVNMSLSAPLSIDFAHYLITNDVDAFSFDICIQALKA